ncbi:capsid cement protein [Hydrogenophaga sp. A37]|uniref:capsid cement protein n=1 Tax=Hydrogenophaga sp. A37 TaxID=1945864 RepID=UPI000985052C|nr:capsid cement protein [Hydrogenophaga sp. A37]OOG84256.1 DUF2190 domain-containing protein [Hydrogenophaga sp. A37]
MKTSIVLCTMSVLAAAALTKQRFVTAAGAVPAAGAYCPGVANANYDAGEQAGLDTHGIIVVEAGAAVTAGDAVQCDASGRAITLAAGASLARALDAATAAGDLIRVKL